MREEPLISILMGVYNCADTLEEAVKCIEEQTYENWELIICDDCSSDRTFEIAQELAKKESRIVVLKNENNFTLAPTLNKCLEVARGNFIARMDGDDCCHKERLKRELYFLMKHSEYALVSCQMELFDAQGVYKLISHIDVPEKKHLVKKSQFCHAGCMIRADVMKELGGYRIEKSINRVEDYDLWIRLYNAGYKGFNIQEPLYSMRDDRYAQKRSTWLNRINEAKVKWYACRVFELPIYSYFYAAIPIIKWMMPNFLYNLVHKKS